MEMASSPGARVVRAATAQELEAAEGEAEVAMVALITLVAVTGDLEETGGTESWKWGSRVTGEMAVMEASVPRMATVVPAAKVAPVEPHPTCPGVWG